MAEVLYGVTPVDTSRPRLPLPRGVLPRRGVRLARAEIRRALCQTESFRCAAIPVRTENKTLGSCTLGINGAGGGDLRATLKPSRFDPRGWPNCLGLRLIALLALSLSGSLRGADPFLNVGNTRGYSGTSANVPIFVRRATNVVAAQFDIAFNSGKSSAGNAMAGTAMIDHVIKSRELAPGVRRVLIYSLNNTALRTNGTVALIPFNVASTERLDSGPLIPSNVILAKRDATRVAPLTLNSGKIFVSPIQLNPDGQVAFFLSSEPDRTYVIETPTNLLDWIPISTKVADGDFMDLMDQHGAGYPSRFYKAVAQP